MCRISYALLLLIFTIFVIGVPEKCEAQKVIKLSKASSDKEIILTSGMRISYIAKNHQREKVGYLHSIFEDAIVVDSTYLMIDDIVAIGKRKKGARFWSVLGASFGGAMIGSIFSPEPNPCPSCQTVIVEDKGGKAGDFILVVGGAALAAYSIHSFSKNSVKYIQTGGWNIEVVE